MESIYKKSILNKITRNNYQYRLARNIACKYDYVWAVAWDSLDENDNLIAVGVNAKPIHKNDEFELKSFIHHHVNVCNHKISFAKCYDNLPIKSWI